MENIDVSEVKESLKETADDLTAEDLINLDNDQESADEDVIEVNIEKPKEITPQHVSRLLECLNEARDIVTEFDSNIDRTFKSHLYIEFYLYHSILWSYELTRVCKG